MRILRKDGHVVTECEIVEIVEPTDSMRYVFLLASPC